MKMVVVILQPEMFKKTQNIKLREMTVVLIKRLRLVVCSQIIFPKMMLLEQAVVLPTRCKKFWKIVLEF